jgi:hypothetical protein
VEETTRDGPWKATHSQEFNHFRKAKEFQEYSKGWQEDEEEDVVDAFD